MDRIQWRAHAKISIWATVLALIAMSTLVAVAVAIPVPNISGTVTDMITGEPLADVDVVVYATGAEGYHWVWWGVTDGNGLYEVDGLDDGEYRLEFFTWSDEYRTEYYNDRPDLESADPVVVAGGTAAGSFDVAMARSDLAITGVVTDESTGDPIADVDVIAYSFSEQAGWVSEWWGRTDANGVYALYAVPDGEYHIEYFDLFSGYDTEFYDNKPDLETSDPVLVIDGLAAGSYDVQMSRGGLAIAGTVTDEVSGAPLEGIIVLAFAQGGDLLWESVWAGETGVSGGYAAHGLPDGVYRIGFYDSSDEYAIEHWDDVPEVEDADDIVVVGGTAQGSYDASLARTPVGFTVGEVAGANRYQTAIAASLKAYPSGLDLGGHRTVVIATGRNWPDALGGAALAGVLDGPVLLTDTGSVSSAVLDEITRLKATKAIIVGGTGAVGSSVEAALASKLGPGKVERISGADRYETADKIGKRVIALTGPGFDGTAFIATGGSFPDALAAAPLVAKEQWPLFLAHPTGGLSAATKTAMAGVDTAVIVGGTGAVSVATETGLKSTYGAGSVTRLQGANRYATAAAISAYGVSECGLTWNKLAITTGTDFPDALAGGILQAKVGSVMLLTPATTLHAETGKRLTDNKATIKEITFLGGTGAVSQAVRDAATNLVK